MRNGLEKMEWNITISEQQEKATMQLKEELLQDPDVRRLSEIARIPMKVLLAHPWKVDSWRKHIQPCKHCKGLAVCKSGCPVGYRIMLAYDGILKEEVSACRYKNKELDATKHMNQYIVDRTLPASMKTVSLNHLDLKSETKTYASSVVKIYDAFANNRGIYLYGTMGVGKTYLAAGACNDQARKGLRVAFVCWPEFVEDMKSLFMTGEYKEYIDKLKRAQFAVLDDIGAESVTDWCRDQILFPVLNARYEAGLPTWLTSNEDLTSLCDHFTVGSKGSESTLKAKRIIERITAMCDIIQLQGEYRR